jgi:hypothetical protein
MAATIPRERDATVNLSYAISHAGVRRLGTPSRWSMVADGGEREHYQYTWTCGCIVRELDRRYRIAPCAAHRRNVPKDRDVGVWSWFRAACCALVFLGASPAPSSTAEPTAAPIAAPSPSAESTAAQQELATFASEWSRISAYRATVTVFEQSGQNVQNVVFDYTFRKPSDVTVHVAEGPNAGVTLTWSGGETVVARRGSGLAALFKRTLSLHDPLATTIRGSSIDQLSFGAILAHAQGTAGTLSAAKENASDGSSATSVTLEPAVAATDAALTKEIIEISSTTHLPVRVLGYDGTTLVRKIDFSNVTVQE